MGSDQGREAATVGVTVQRQWVGGNLDWGCAPALSSGTLPEFLICLSEASLILSF